MNIHTRVFLSWFGKFAPWRFSLRAVISSAALAVLTMGLASGVRAEPPKVLFVGDSITSGLGATIPEEGGFVALLSKRFKELVIANAGCPGSTLRDWTTDDVAEHCALGGAWVSLAEPQLPAKMTHIMLGANDATGFFESIFINPHGRFVSKREYGVRLRELVARAPGVVLLSAPAPNASHPSGPVDDRLRDYREVVSRIVEEDARVLDGVDFYALLDLTLDMDGVHPNDRGHARMADALELRMLEIMPVEALGRCKGRSACREGRSHSKRERSAVRRRH
jgi:lysophospholipase L1-like esterase